jgi:putative membrane protein
VIVVGVLRVIYGLKGWEFYVYNTSFWAKMVAFAAVGLISTVPTVRILGWRRAMQRTTGLYVAPDAEIAGVRRAIRWQMAIFLLIPIFAAMMARGVY